MPSTDLIKEADRIMTICNACRYCEGYCAVFPAMELRRSFSEGDLKYLANLCHDCRDCYYACQYAPPHEFDLNVPRTLTELRLETYKEFCWPAPFKKLFERNGITVAAITLLSVFVVMLVTCLASGSETFFGAHAGPGAFYQVVPYAVMVALFSALGIFILVSHWKGVDNLWRKTGGGSYWFFDPAAHFQAIKDVLRLRYLEGGGEGCNYPDDRFSMSRRYFHHAVFYGFFLCLASTTVAMIYDHVLGLEAPYPVWSLPVVLGTIGGIALLIGTGGMLTLKFAMDRDPACLKSLGMDVTFTVLLFLTSFTGLLLLFLRATPFMGTLLTAHLGVVLGLFITMPYSKFIHVAYRYTALVRNAIEQAENRED